MPELGNRFGYLVVLAVSEAATSMLDYRRR